MAPHAGMEPTADVFNVGPAGNPTNHSTLSILPQTPDKVPGSEVKKLTQTAQKFNPTKHLVFRDPPEVLTMQDIGMADDIGVSPVAVTQPFRLFSPDAIQMMRAEIEKDEVTKNHTFSSNLAATQLRGYARDHAPFTYEAWTHEATTAIVSQLAGVDLMPWGDYEIAHINLSRRTEEQVKAELSAIQKHKDLHVDEAIAANSSEKDKPIVGWHRDSYPYVCVLMMSDCTNMVGGETALQTGNGEVIRIRGPTEGCAVILQGRYITHQALRALGAKERITAVTSYRPRSPFVKDDSVLRTVRPVSDLNELYYDFSEYRLEIMEQRFHRKLEEMRARRKVGARFDTAGHKSFLAESAAFLQSTNKEIVPEAEVHKGSIETVNIPDVQVGPKVLNGERVCMNEG